jgi:hypothetical protein
VFTPPPPIFDIILYIYIFHLFLIFEHVLMIIK